MKSYFLEGMSDRRAVERALSERLPGQADPWLLLAAPDDPIAYFHCCPACEEEGTLGPFLIQANVSGRHYDRDEPVLSVLRDIRDEVGGRIKDDDDALL